MKQGLTLNLWQYNQVTSRCMQDKRTFDFSNKHYIFDCIINAGDKKLLSKNYKYLLTLTMTDEQIKEPMILFYYIFY